MIFRKTAFNPKVWIFAKNLMLAQKNLAGISDGIYRPETFARRCILTFVLMCLLLTVIQLIGNIDFISQNKEKLFGGDFVNYWSGAVLFRHGLIEEIFDPSRFHLIQELLLQKEFEDHLWSYPAHALLFLYPLGGLSYGAGYLLWTVLGLGLYLYSVRQSTTKDCRLIVCAALLVAPSTIENAFTGQTGFFTAALFVSGMSQVDRRPVLAGILIGCLTFKPHMGLLIPVALMAAGHWRTFVSAAGTTLCLLGLSMVVLGVESWQLYIQNVLPMQRWLLEIGTSYYTLMMPSAFMAARKLGLDLPLCYAVQASLSGLAFGLVFWAYRYGRDREKQLVALIAATVLVSPYVFTYDMTLLSIAVVMTVQRAFRTGLAGGEAYVLAAAWALPLYLVQLNWLSILVGPFVLGVFALLAARQLCHPAMAVAKVNTELRHPG